jgi:serpin B
MPDAFSESKADFSGITNKESLIIDQVVHKAYIDVDTEGTEAAAVTAIMVIPISNDIFKKEPVEMTVDRPFIFLIRDIETGTILFLGRVLNPIE